ncbi:MAG: nascent polypeptide-associated complex protein [Thermoprotei archaeon]|nr:MAG: nascent polypeptide-associated complex protein [Thermoprotei archaeon]
MGIDVSMLTGVKRIVIEFEEKDIIIEDPQVAVITVKGQKIYQIIPGTEKVVEGPKEVAVEISEEDIKFVAEQAGVSIEEARAALLETGGDIAQAIMLLESRRSKS